jgi:hypothetical protein
VLAQPVVDRDALEHVAAGAVDVDVTSLLPIARSAASIRFTVTPPPVHGSSPITS